MTVSVPPHAANPFGAELYTAVVCRPRSPDRADHSNAFSESTAAAASACRGNSRMLAELIHRCDVTDAILMFRVAPVMSHSRCSCPRERAAGRGVTAECMAMTHMFVFYDWPFPLHTCVGLLWKNVAYFPFNSWLSFQRLCRFLWGL